MVMLTNCPLTCIVVPVGRDWTPTDRRATAEAVTTGNRTGCRHITNEGDKMTAYEPDALDFEAMAEASQMTYPLKLIAERVLPEGDADRVLIVALSDAIERLYSLITAIDEHGVPS